MATDQTNLSQLQSVSGKAKRKSGTKGGKIMRWDAGVDQHVLLAIQYLATKGKIQIDWNEVGSVVADHCTGESINQHLIKVREGRVDNDQAVPPPIDYPKRKEKPRDAPKENNNGQGKGPYAYLLYFKPGQEKKRKRGWEADDAEEEQIENGPIPIPAKQKKTKLLQDRPTNFPQPAEPEEEAIQTSVPQQKTTYDPDVAFMNAIEGNAPEEMFLQEGGFSLNPADDLQQLTMGDESGEFWSGMVGTAEGEMMGQESMTFPTNL